MPQTRDLYSKKLILRCHCSGGREEEMGFILRFQQLKSLLASNIVKMSWNSIVKKIPNFRSKCHKISSVVKKGEHRENLLKRGEPRGKRWASWKSRSWKIWCRKNIFTTFAFFQEIFTTLTFFHNIENFMTFWSENCDFFPMLFHDIFTDLYEITQRFHNFFTMFAASNDQCEQFYQSTFMKSFWGFLWSCLR